MANLKYILFALASAILLKYNSQLNMTDEQIMYTVLVATVVVFMINRRSATGVEGMVAVLPETCPTINALPSPYMFNTLYEDNAPTEPYVEDDNFSGPMMRNEEVQAIVEAQRYNNDVNTPGYYLTNNGKYSETGIPYSSASNLISTSKVNDLFNQHNYNIQWSPHTHFGKARGHLNWDRNF